MKNGDGWRRPCGNSWLHIASHGFTNKKCGELSCLEHVGTGGITTHGDMTVGEATNLWLDRLVALEYCVFVCLICGIMMYYNVLCIRMCMYIYIHIHTEMWCPSRIDLVFPKSPDSLTPSASPTPATAPGPDVPLQFGSGWGWWGATVENGWCVVLLKCFKRWEKKQWLVNTILITCRANHQEILIAV